MKRRDFLIGAGAIALACPVQAQVGFPLIGLVGSGSAESNIKLLDAFRRGLRTVGYTEGQNLKIEYRWAAGNYDRVPALISDLLNLHANVLVTFDNTAIAIAAKAATKTTPVVFSIGTDPIKFGLVTSLSHPEGNVTGATILTVGLGVKRFQMLRELLPDGRRFALLVNPKNPATQVEAAAVVSAGAADGVAILILNASTPSEIDAAFASAIEQRAAGLLIQSEPFLSSRHSQTATLTAKHSIPVIDAYREFVEAGGLMSYGASQRESKRVIGIYAGRILKGEKPMDLPVQQSTKIELLINLKVAEILGLTVPTSLLVRADEVIE